MGVLAELMDNLGRLKLLIRLIRNGLIKLEMAFHLLTAPSHWHICLKSTRLKKLPIFCILKVSLQARYNLSGAPFSALSMSA
jgi:hypothetical protein